MSYRRVWRYLATVATGLTLMTTAGGAARADSRVKEFTSGFDIGSCTFATTGTNPFFILEPGFQQTYEGDLDKAHVMLTVTVLNDTQMVNGTLTRVVEEREVHDGLLEEVSRNYYAICGRTDSVFNFGEDVDIYDESGNIVSHEGAWHSGENGATAGIIMPGDVLLGQRYYQETAPDVALDQAETIEMDQTAVTPAGTFDGCIVSRETTPLEPGKTEYKLYAPGVGVVQDETLQLTWYGDAF